MLRSMYSGISGMKNFQVKLDVIGNNISNVNTFGFKKGRVTFKDMVSQNISGATGPSVNGQNVMGGKNSMQVGLGTQIGTIDTVHTQGSLQTTGRVLDLALSGNGYFVVQDANGQDYYTRAGNFYTDAQDNLVNSDGLSIQGKMYDVNDSTAAAVPGSLKIPATATDASGNSVQLKSISIGKDGLITAIYDGDTSPRNVAQLDVATFSNNEGLEKAGGNLFLPSANSGTPVVGSAASGGAGSIVSGALEMSNVDLSEEFTEMIVAQRGFQANTRIITTSDEILQELVNLKR